MLRAAGRRRPGHRGVGRVLRRPQQGGPRFHRQPLLTDVLDAALPADHPRADSGSIELAELAGDDWVVGSPGTSCQDVVEVACGAAGFTPRAVHQTSDWAAVAALVADGTAVALIPRLAQTTIPEGVVLRPLHRTAAARHVFAATRRGTTSTPTAARALQCLQEVADQLHAVTR